MEVLFGLEAAGPAREVIEHQLSKKPWEEK